MKITGKYKVREMAGQHVIIIQGKLGGDMTRVISLNGTSLFLWDKFKGADFTVDEVAAALIDEYGIDEARAAEDASSWCSKLAECGLLEG